MNVKMILPALTEATSPFFRPIKYSLLPPLGLATLAGYLRDDDEVEIQDEHVEKLDIDDVPDLVVIQVYITSARRAYRLADHYRRRGAHVALGGLHVTSLPAEAAHADTIFLGPGEDTWPAFLADFRRGCAARVYRSQTRTRDRALTGPASVLSRRSPLRRPTLCGGALRRHAGGSIVRGASAHDTVVAGLRHAAYAAGWKKFEPAWDLVIRAKRAGMMLPILETLLSQFGSRSNDDTSRRCEGHEGLTKSSTRRRRVEHPLGVLRALR